MKKIAIVGAGFSGLALTYFLAHTNKWDITLFDKSDIGEGTSGIAAGLLHPFVGKEAKLNWKGLLAIKKTKKLLEVSSRGLNQPVFISSGILRLSQSDEQQKAFVHSASMHSELSLRSTARNQTDVQGLAPLLGLWIPNGISIDTRNYLKGLWRASKSENCRFMKKNIQSLQELNEYDSIVLASGAGTEALVDVKLQLIKGQILRLAWPESLPALPFPLIGSKYLVMCPDGKSCWAGSTYEKKALNFLPDQNTAEKIIIPEIEKIVPSLARSKVMDCEAGVRVFTPNRRPFFNEIRPGVWVFTGMGSKGLLYHALLAEELAREINKQF